MKLDALDDLLSKLQGILISVLKLYQPIRKFFFQLCIAAVLFVDDNKSAKFMFCEQVSVGRHWHISHPADICFRSKRKLELILTFRNTGNIKTN